MTYFPPRTFALIAACMLAVITAHARIGESKSTIERRITAGNRGIVIDDDIANFYLDRSPLKSAMLTPNSKGELVPHDDLNLSVGVYYKKVGNDRAFSSELVGRDGKPVREPDGWLLFVVYYKDRSVLEVYTRSGSINEAESNGLLAMNQASSSWVKGALPEDKYPNKDYKPLLPNNLHRTDGEMAANLNGNSIMIFMINTDDLLGKAKKERENQSAPDSLAGF
ncbi:hypothetical protein [Cerasicoccus arenae]|uniref:Uncharacterized protein n=1 Tax=Cerasicoccus arenae TaxID=424488 RepID=A0A8J3DI71_9BACT|nr:hypothetical protein [Cerasicoccus arenae]MBK1858485.1 hypothetical protein [Cerasicoccus arenae]GHC10358.1 hypothetical protein GCM10007047_29620 [Cerasicoccus arenae]